MDPEGFFPLIVRGGRGVTATYDGSALTVQFRKSGVAAGEPASYGRVPLGSAAWVDRATALRVLAPASCRPE
jgi:hypothetical protein